MERRRVVSSPALNHHKYTSPPPCPSTPSFDFLDSSPVSLSFLLPPNEDPNVTYSSSSSLYMAENNINNNDLLDVWLQTPALDPTFSSLSSPCSTAFSDFVTPPQSPSPSTSHLPTSTTPFCTPIKSSNSSIFSSNFNTPSSSQDPLCIEPSVLNSACSSTTSDLLFQDLNDHNAVPPSPLGNVLGSLTPFNLDMDEEAADTTIRADDHPVTETSTSTSNNYNSNYNNNFTIPFPSESFSIHPPPPDILPQVPPPAVSLPPDSFFNNNHAAEIGRKSRPTTPGPMRHRQQRTSSFHHPYSLPSENNSNNSNNQLNNDNSVTSSSATSLSTYADSATNLFFNPPTPKSDFSTASSFNFKNIPVLPPSQPQSPSKPISPHRRVISGPPVMRRLKPGPRPKNGKPIYTHTALNKQQPPQPPMPKDALGKIEQYSGLSLAPNQPQPQSIHHPRPMRPASTEQFKDDYYSATSDADELDIEFDTMLGIRSRTTSSSTASSSSILPQQNNCMKPASQTIQVAGRSLSQDLIQSMYTITTDSDSSTSNDDFSSNSNKAKRYVCLVDNCGQSFPRRTAIVNHIQTHLDDRPFVCLEPDCGAAFVRQHDLRRHARSHSKIKPHTCPCGKSFARGDALQRHRERGICSGSVVPRRVVSAGAAHR